MMPVASSESLAEELVQTERDLFDRKKDIEMRYPDLAHELREMDRLTNRVEALKQDLKQALVEEDDYDIHEVDGKKYSVSKVVKLAVDNIDLVPAEFKSVMEVANEKKAQDYYKLFGDVPAGFVDKSYNKLNYKDA